jgi:hypothetical protein
VTFGIHTIANFAVFRQWMPAHWTNPTRTVEPTKRSLFQGRTDDPRRRDQIKRSDGNSTTVPSNKPLQR